MLDGRAGKCSTCKKPPKAWPDRFKRVKALFGGLCGDKKGEYTPINQDWDLVYHESDHELDSYEFA